MKQSSWHYTCISLLLGFFVAYSFCNATYTNKTFLSPRPSGLFFPFELPVLEGARDNDIIIRATPSAAASTNHKDLTAYFTYGCNTSCLSVGIPAVYEASIFNVDAQNFSFLSAPGSLQSNISFSPKVERAQIRIDYYQALDLLLKNLFIAATIPVIYTRQNMHMNVSNASCNQNSSIIVQNYFSGGQMMTVNEPNSGSCTNIALQEPLQYSRISCDRHTLGVADIYFSLGYTCIRNEDTLLQTRLETIFPTSSTSQGKYLFEVREGNGGHWGIGLRADCLYKLWQKATRKHHFLQLALMTRWNYLFGATEHRTIGLKSAVTGCLLPWSRYQLVGALNLPLVLPLANVLTQAVSVRPRNLGEILAAFTYQHGQFSIRAGYDLWAKNAEQIKQKQSWCNTGYAFPTSTYATKLAEFPDSQAIFNLNEATNNNSICMLDPVGGGSTINPCQLDYDNAASPGTLTQTVFASAEYTWHGRTPISVGIGGAYEIPENNAALRMFYIWATGSFSF